MNLTYRKYTNEDFNEVVDLLKFLWSDSLEKRESYFRWKYNDNPCGRNIMAFVAVDKEKVVGFRGFFPQSYIVNHHESIVASLADTVVHPDYRRLGIFSGLTKFSIKELSNNNDATVLLNTTPSWPTVPGYVNLGWKEIAKKEYVVYIDLRNFFLNKLINCEYDLPKVINLGESEEFEITKTLDASGVEKLSKSERCGISILKSENYLKWRYSNPMMDYTFFHLRKNNELVGFISTCKIDSGEYMIMDIEYDNYYCIRRLLKNFRRYFNKKKVYCWSFTFNKELSNVFFANSFYKLFIIKRIIKRNKYLLPVLARTISGTDDFVNDLNVLDINNWRINPLDSDGF